MKVLSRRLFVKALPAAPLAAPTLAQEAMGNMPPPPPAEFASGSVPATPIDDRAWAKERRTMLERIIRGEPDEREELDRKGYNWRALAYHYDSIRSLSPVMRARLYADATYLRQKERQRLWAMFEMKDLIKKFF